ncbi:MAG TPA: 3-hydroxyacyl-ACP dehydratase FabZ family protein [Verrucomicrobiae bacterium]|nr:3-hydroxyacyl-ACP dehydratase FabZ family protein [Verrucomicrobiae bacterium]
MTPAPSWSKALESLPHGPEFRFLDRLISLDPGKSGVGEYAVRGDEPFLKGHFPGQPLFPGVLLVESAAQLAGTVVQSDPQIPPMTGLKLTAIRGVKILGTARPGQSIRLEAKILNRLNNLVQVQVAAAVDGQPILMGELTMSGEMPSCESTGSGRK